jgi:hypothetical protein
MPTTGVLTAPLGMPEETPAGAVSTGAGGMPVGYCPFGASLGMPEETPAGAVSVGAGGMPVGYCPFGASLPPKEVLMTEGAPALLPAGAEGLMMGGPIALLASGAGVLMTGTPTVLLTPGTGGGQIPVDVGLAGYPVPVPKPVEPGAVPLGAKPVEAEP